MIPQELMAVAHAEREREVARLMVAREAEAATKSDTQSTQDGWTWRIEPGMGEVFESLRGWLLPRAAGGAVEHQPRAGESS